MRDILKSSVQKLDLIIWGVTILFFLLSALFLGWIISSSILWAIGIIILMFFVGLSIELILAALQNVKWLWAITGFITNGPEALVLIVWLIWGNVLFAASTPLGSNVMNPILLLLALIVSWVFFKLQDFKYKKYFSFAFLITAFFALIFFVIWESLYPLWLLTAVITTVILFRKKFDYEEQAESNIQPEKYYLPLGIVMLLVSGFFLDPIVSYTAEASKAPKGVIGFLVLATLTSWPEFKSVLSLFNKWKILDGFVNIFVSNITNIWLAASWVLVWLITQYL